MRFLLFIVAVAAGCNQPVSSTASKDEKEINEIKIELKALRGKYAVMEKEIDELRKQSEFHTSQFHMIGLQMGLQKLNQR